MKKAIPLILASMTAFVAGAGVMSLARPPVPVEKSEKPSVVIQVPPGESWAAAWDVENGHDISPVSGIEPGERYLVNEADVSQHAIILANGNLQSGLILTNGQCHVYRRDTHGNVTKILLCKLR